MGLFFRCNVYNKEVFCNNVSYDKIGLVTKYGKEQRDLDESKVYSRRRWTVL